MSKGIYSKSLGISSEDVSKCENPFQLKDWYLQIYRDCINIKDGIDFIKDDPSQRDVLLKRKSALRSQVQLLKEISIRHNEVKHGVYPAIKEIVAFYQQALKVLPSEMADKITSQAMKSLGVVI